MNDVNLNETKRKLRELKKLEMKIRHVGNEANAGLVWNDFFAVRYPLKIVAAMDKETYKKVIEEYFYRVYYKLFAENNPGAGANYDPEILSRLGLPPSADAGMIKQKFRELSKIYHPDAGGGAGDFIRLMEDYEALTGRKSRSSR